MDIKKLMSNWPKLEKPSAIFFFFFFYSTVTNLIGQNKKKLLSQYTQIILLTLFLCKDSSRSPTRSNFLRRARTFSPDIMSLFLIFFLKCDYLFSRRKLFQSSSDNERLFLCLYIKLYLSQIPAQSLYRPHETLHTFSNNILRSANQKLLEFEQRAWTDSGTNICRYVLWNNLKMSVKGVLQWKICVGVRNVLIIIFFIVKFQEYFGCRFVFCSILNKIYAGYF